MADPGMSTPAETTWRFSHMIRKRLDRIDCLENEIDHLRGCDRVGDAVVGHPGQLLSLGVVAPVPQALSGF